VPDHVMTVASSVGVYLQHLRLLTKARGPRFCI